MRVQPVFWVIMGQRKKSGVIEGNPNKQKKKMLKTSLTIVVLISVLTSQFQFSDVSFFFFRGSF